MDGVADGDYADLRVLVGGVLGLGGVRTDKEEPLGQPAVVGRQIGGHNGL